MKHNAFPRGGDWNFECERGIEIRGSGSDSDPQSNLPAVAENIQSFTKGSAMIDKDGVHSNLGENDPINKAFRELAAQNYWESDEFKRKIAEHEASEREAKHESIFKALLAAATLDRSVWECPTGPIAGISY